MNPFRPLLAALACMLPLAATAQARPPITLDTHVDIPFDYMAAPRFDVGTATPLKVDLGKMEKGGLDAAFFVIWVPQGPLDAAGYAEAEAEARRKYDAIGHMLFKYPDRIRLATTPAAVRANRAAGRLSALIGIENAYSLGHDLARLDVAWDRGARYVGLVHVGNNDLCSSSLPDTAHGEPAMNAPDDPGMSAFGRAVVQRANALGMLVDVSHASDACTRAALETSRAPIIASHSGARAVLEHPRNLPDALVRAIAAKGGVVQAVAYKEFLKYDPAREAAEKALAERVAHAAGDAAYDSDRHDYLPTMAAGMATIEREHPLATLDDYVRQIRHLVAVAGIDHVGIASDFDGGGGVTGWNDASQTPQLTAALARAGFSDADIAKLWGGNFLRVWQQVLDDAAP